MKAGEGGKGGWEMSLTREKGLERPSEHETRVTDSAGIAYGEKTCSNSNWYRLRQESFQNMETNKERQKGTYERHHYVTPLRG